MRYEIEPSGCCERRGLMQIRFSFFLEPGEHGYEVHHMEDGTDNPFHNHFVYVEPSITDEALMVFGKYWCRQAFRKWRDGLPMRMGAPPKFPRPEKVMARQRRAIKARLKGMRWEELSGHCQGN